MLSLEPIISGLITVVTYSLLMLSIFKIFQIGTDVKEMKELLKDLRRNAPLLDQARQAPAVSPPASPEELVRAVHAASYEEIDEAIGESRKQA
ncbi:MAG TPA: hypothetical protein VMG40_10995 [Bryobacteraceae bacterium]|nr:hypothetical protein [Bryobacteraceae bacterium]